MIRYSALLVLCLGLLVALAKPASAQRRMENLTRGIVAVKQTTGVYIGWRLFGTDPEAIGFNLYRITAGGEPVKVNAKPITDTTNYIDNGADLNQELAYFVRPVLNGKELAPSRPARAWNNNYLEIPIQTIDDYQPGDASIADLDGDGEYEIVLHQGSHGRDNSFAGITGAPIFDAYEMDGTHMWRINLGINIRDGEHYTQFMVYDLDGDGSAEMACKTADGTTDGKGNVIGDKDKDWRTYKEGNRTHGRILDGPEYLTIFDGRTGEALTTVDYIPNRYPIDGWGGIGGNGGNDNYGNRCDRFLACVAYLDGVQPSLVMCRGVYGRTVLAAWDWRDGKLPAVQGRLALLGHGRSLTFGGGRGRRREGRDCLSCHGCGRQRQRSLLHRLAARRLDAHQRYVSRPPRVRGIHDSRKRERYRAVQKSRRGDA